MCAFLRRIKFTTGHVIVLVEVCSEKELAEAWRDNNGNILGEQRMTR
jgi:hypothetical protein